MAPIARSGSATRSTGRRRSELSPVITVRNGRAATTPASIRSVEPELPASSGAGDGCSDAGPRPTTSTTDRPARRVDTPSASRHRSVELQSSAVEKFANRLSPWASAARMARRCESDLSPGRVNRPRKCRLWATRMGTWRDRAGSYHAPAQVPALPCVDRPGGACYGGGSRDIARGAS